MKVLFFLLALGGFILVVGGLGSVAKDTYPAALPMIAEQAHPVATAGNPTLLIICVIAVVVGLVAGIKGR